MTSLSTIDLIVVIAYAIGIFGLAQWVSREKAGHAKDTSDYFLASKSLPWWAIGASLIAANISAEQIVGMAGSGYKIGLAIAVTYRKILVPLISATESRIKLDKSIHDEVEKVARQLDDLKTRGRGSPPATTDDTA